MTHVDRSLTTNRLGTWDPDPEEAEASTRRQAAQGRVSDFLLFALLPMAELQFSGRPVPELAMGCAVFLALLRRPTVRRVPLWLVTLLPALFGLMVLSSVLNDLTPYRRLLHVALYVALAIFAGQGRFNVPAMSRGLATGLLVSAAAYYAGFGTDYVGRLAGLMADPNSAGYLLTTLGCLALGGLRSGPVRNLVGVLLLVAVVLTYSRTSLLAAILVLVWVLVGRLLGPFLGAVLLGAMVFMATNIPISLRTFGPFADRIGSDALRMRIVAQEHLQVASAPWYGHGPGTSQVDVLGESFFFHNSYLSLQNEAGRLAQLLLIGAGVCALVSLLRQKPALRNAWYEAALISVAVCAVNLGEVLLELPAALALGMAAYHARSVAEASGSSSDAEPHAQSGQHVALVGTRP
jgi:hypothetical protein